MVYSRLNPTPQGQERVHLGWEPMSVTWGGWLLSRLNPTPQGQELLHWPEHLDCYQLNCSCSSFSFTTLWTTIVSKNKAMLLRYNISLNRVCPWY